MSNKLYRNPDGKFMGVCSGLSDYLRIDVSLIRLAFIIGTFITGGVVVFVYILMGIFLPMNDYRNSDSVFTKMKDGYWENGRKGSFKRGVNVRDVKDEFDNLKSRVSKMEDSVFNKEKDWDERFRNS